MSQHILSDTGRAHLNAQYDRLSREVWVDAAQQRATNSSLLAVEGALRDDARARGVSWPDVEAGR